MFYLYGLGCNRTGTAEPPASGAAENGLGCNCTEGSAVRLGAVGDSCVVRFGAVGERVARRGVRALPFLADGASTA